MSEDQCVATKNDGEECEYAAKYPDDKCGIHSEHNERTPAGGRPSKLDDHEQDILTGARQGMTLEGCARLAGVAESTLHKWINENDEFSKSLKRARAQGELKHLQSVNDSGSRFILERSYGYVKTEKREVDADHRHEHDATEVYASLVGAASDGETDE
jgi:transposase